MTGAATGPPGRTWRDLARDDADALGFTPQDAVRWLAPSELLRAGVKVVVSKVFADFADKRELQGTLQVQPIVVPEVTPGGETWFDFTADTGDGFDATCTVAGLLGAPSLRPEGQAAELPRGSMLVLGGDEVYPSASAKAYEDRMLGPYEAGFPKAAVGDGPRPLLLALPGNHDWYDGLTAFLRIFTHRRSIGGWVTAQSRSYFAVQLPHRWWLLGLDSQFGTYIDEPQLAYFEKTVSRHLQPGDGIILCAATPTWVKSHHDPTAFDSLVWFDQHYLRNRPVDVDTYEPTGASVRLWLTGDSHHYARYAEVLAGEPAGAAATPDPRRRQLITCGLGGAFTSATHDLPRALELPSPGSRVRERETSAGYAAAAELLPAHDDSRSMAKRLAMPWRPEWLPRRNPGMAELFGGLHVVVFVLLLGLYAAAGRRTPVGVLRRDGALDAVQFLWHGLVVAGVLALLVLAGSWVRSRAVRPPSPTAWMVLGQLALALVVLLAAMAVPWGRSVDGYLVLLLAVLLAGLVGALLGPALLAVQVVLTRSGPAVGWQMSGQADEGDKGFLRIRIGTDGALTVHPLTVARPVRRWVLEDLPDGRKRPVPAEAPTVRLIEEPVVVARSVTGPGEGTT